MSTQKRQEYMSYVALDFPKNKSHWPLLHFATYGIGLIKSCCQNEGNVIRKERQLQYLLVYDVQTVQIKIIILADRKLVKLVLGYINVIKSWNTEAPQCNTKCR